MTYGNSRHVVGSVGGPGKTLARHGHPAARRLMGHAAGRASPAAILKCLEKQRADPSNACQAVVSEASSRSRPTGVVSACAGKAIDGPPAVGSYAPPRCTPLPAGQAISAASRNPVECRPITF